VDGYMDIVSELSASVRHQYGRCVFSHTSETPSAMHVPVIHNSVIQVSINIIPLKPIKRYTNLWKWNGTILLCFAQ